MGSRLCDELREQRALCYWVDGHVWGFESAAFLSVSCSVRPANLAETYERIRAIIGASARTGPAMRRPAGLWRTARGAATLELESADARLEHAVELIMQYDDHDVDPIQRLRALAAVTRDELAELAATIRLEPCVGMVGPATAAQLT